MVLQKNWLQLIVFVICIVSISQGIAQNVYKTPSGKKYHLETCRMVVNVSAKLVDNNDIVAFNLDPCKICKPPLKIQRAYGTSYTNKAVGQSATVRCKGYTLQGTRCKHMTRIANGYCFQHTEQDGQRPGISQPVQSNLYNSNSVAVACGAATLSGSPCKRKVKGGGYCYQHR